AHFAEYGAVGLFLHVGVDDARLQFLLGVGVRRITDRALLIAQLILQEERVRPVEVFVRRTIQHFVVPALRFWLPREFYREPLPVASNSIGRDIGTRRTFG